MKLHTASSGVPQHFVSGALIVLVGCCSDMVDRQRWRGREGDSKYIERQQKALVRAYGARNARGCRVVDTGGLGVDAVVKQVLRAIHLEPYVEYSMRSRLEKFLPRAAK